MSSRSSHDKPLHSASGLSVGSRIDLCAIFSPGCVSRGRERWYRTYRLGMVYVDWFPLEDSKDAFLSDLKDVHSTEFRHSLSDIDRWIMENKFTHFGTRHTRLEKAFSKYVLFRCLSFWTLRFAPDRTLTRKIMHYIRADMFNVGASQLSCLPPSEYAVRLERNSFITTGCSVGFKHLHHLSFTLAAPRMKLWLRHS